MSDATGDQPIFILAMDHRESLAKSVYGLDEEPAAGTEDAAAISGGKRLVLAGLLQAIDRGAPKQNAGVLVDERYGADVARDARAAGITLAMPIEHSGRDWFELEYGSLDERTWLDHVAEFAPDHCKVLVRDNPDFDADKRAAQRHDLAIASRALHDAGRSFLFELLVPPTDAQKARHGDDYDRVARPALTEQVVAEFQAADVEPDVWKIEGLEEASAARRIVEVTQQGGREHVRCIVLGRDAPQDDLDRWLTTDGPVAGFAGFAIGRSIWEQPLKDQLAGRIDDPTMVSRVADAYLHFTGTYERAVQPA